ncbi:hypothetical protein TWF481_011849 [Arthrobotrys musiformis]|uniref:F-box domain-containing protein n=1 Tax=Arthrobotrys musiformis TaxID=47236 RepID=A0AAV9VXQ5_9PEZI
MKGRGGLILRGKKGIKDEEPPFRFLDLPRELRDQVYSYLLSFPPPPKPKPPLSAKFRRFPKAKYPHRALSRPYDLYPHILRVNRQIHDEGAEMLYSRNTFMIQITTDCSIGSRWCGGRRLTRRMDTYNAIYSSPWETIGYVCGRVQKNGEKTAGFFCDPEYYRAGNRDGRTDNYYSPRPKTWPCKCTKCTDTARRTKDFPFLPQTYRALLRRIRIDIYDLRTARSRVLFHHQQQRRHASQRRRKFRPDDDRIRRLLLPFSFLLDRLLSPAGGEATVQITIMPADPATHGELKLDDAVMFFELLETIWPLTLGPWRNCEVEVPDDIIERFRNVYLSMRALYKIPYEPGEAGLGITDEEEEVYRELKVGRGYYWIRSRGVYELVDKRLHKEMECVGEGYGPWWRGWWGAAVRRLRVLRCAAI